MNQVTRILSYLGRGDDRAAAQLLPLVYEELRKLAAQRLRHEAPGQTLQATVLVHEAYVRLVDVDQPQQWNGRGHFFAAAAEAMRRILIESARRRQRVRHGGGRERVPFDQAESQLVTADEASQDELLALDAALARLEATDRQAAEIVKLRFFAGLSMPQIAEALEIPLRTAEREWSYARAWLHRAIAAE